MTDVQVNGGLNGVKDMGLKGLEVNGEVTVNGIEVKVNGHGPADSGVGSSLANTPVTDESPQQITCNGIATALNQVPDKVLDADHLYTWKRDEPVKLRMTESGYGSEKPISVPTLLANVTKKAPNATALAAKRNGEWVKWTYREYQDQVYQAARAMIKLGLERYHAVAIIGFNSPEWFISDLAAIHAGGLAVGIYTTNNPEACHFVLENCEANLVVAENDAQLQKILEVRERLPFLKAIIQYTGEIKNPDPMCYTWKQFMDLGKEESGEELKSRIEEQAVNKCCTLIYTSGTTGNPKGVMISHDNVTWMAQMMNKSAGTLWCQEKFITYLPLSHIAAQILDLYASMMSAAAVYFAQPDALKGSLAHTMKEVRPTLFFGVPRVWEKMQEKMQEIGRNTTGMKKMIADWAKGIGLRGNLSLQSGGSVPFGWTLANMLVFRKVKDALGLDQCNLCISAAAPITRETLEYFLSLNIIVTEVYGMSECTGPHTSAFPWSFRLGTVGKDLHGCTTRLDNQDEDGNGEICMNGRHVMMGYLNAEEKTLEVIDKDGWLHSGDIGKVDMDGFLSITGRIKELIITAGGENIAPVPIEDNVKVELPIISNCMLVGDKRKFLSMLLTLKSEVDADTLMPKDELTNLAKSWCQSVGSNATKVSDIVENKDKNILKAIEEGIARANEKSVSRAQKIAKWSLLPRDFSIPGGELGPTLKLKRPVVHKMYSNTIESLYES